jgi:NNP family nitrate/nitrite transporter-like MFS transporter
MWLPLIAIAIYGAARHMNNLRTARSTFRDQLVITRRKHTWAISWLCVGTFGSFIGYSAAFPLLIKTQFTAVTIPSRFSGRWSARSPGRPAACSPKKSAARA